MTHWGGMVRRSSEEVVRKEDELPDYPKPSSRTDIIIIDEHGLLKKKQLDLLQNCASLDFRLGDYHSIADILNTLEIPVYIREGIIESNHKDFFDEMKRKWGENIPCQIVEFYVDYSPRLRGRYLPKEKIIELFPEEMEDEAKRPDGKVDDIMVMNLLITTLAHEAMHAYFDRPGHERYPYAYFVEEPLAEYGMLVYMNETGMPDEVMDWAHKDVSKKHSCYRYGAGLYDLHIAGDTTIREYLKKYKIGVGKYDVLIIYGTTWKIWPWPVSGRPAISGGAAVRAGISGAGPSSKRFYFEAKSCWRGTGTELYFTIRNEIASDPAFAKFYKQGDTINISFYDKSGVKRIVGTASIVCQHRLRACAQCKDDYAVNFGTSDHRLFGFYEYKSAVGSTPAEWIAKEI